MNKKRIVLPSKKFFNAIDEDITIKVNLDETKNLLREGDRTTILDSSVLFNKERNESNNYKIHGKIKMVFRNMFSGSTTYQPLQKNLYLVDDTGNNFNGFMPYNEFAFLREDVVREINDPESTDVLTAFTKNLIITGQTGHIDTTPTTAPFHNWNLFLTYVYSGDTNYPMKYTLSGNTVYSFVASDGIPFRVTDNGSTLKLTSPVEHGFKSGEYIIISGGTMNNSVPVSGRTFLVTSVGDSYFNSENYVLEINKSELPSGTTLSTVILGRRCINRNNITGTTSTYYVHKHKVLTSQSDYILDKVGFESPIWETEKKLVFENSVGDNDYLVVRNRMESLIYDFREPLVLTGLTNNLGYTPTEVFVSVVFKNGNGYFNYPFKVGFKFNFHDSWIDQHFSGTTSVEPNIPYGTYTVPPLRTFTTGGTITPDTVLTGAFVEYNRAELKERVVSEAFHKLTTPTSVFDHDQDNPASYSGASANNLVGLYYQPHYRIKLRQMSPYIETSRTKEVYGLPQNAKYFEDEDLWKWRDVYDHGFIDPEGFGTNYPFINNTHYVKNDIEFYLRNEKQYTNKQDSIKKVIKFNC
jgi:hypothetical protein